MSLSRRTSSVVVAGAAAVTLPLLVTMPSATAAAPVLKTSSKSYTSVDDGALGQERDQFAYSGTWDTRSGGGKHRGGDHASAQRGATYTVRCYCTQITLLGAKGPAYGTSTVSVDGGPATTVDQYAPAAREDQPLFSTPVLALGDHAVTVTVTGSRSAAATGTLVAVDRAVTSTQNSPTEGATTTSPTTSPTTTTSPAPSPTASPATTSATSPTTSPSPSPTATTVPGSVVWKADGARSFEQDWGSVSTAPECAVVTPLGFASQRIAQVAGADSPSPTGRFYRANVRPGDACYGSRAELGQGNPVKTFTDGTGDRLFREGEERWISFASRLAPNYPIDASKWSLIFQWKQTAKYGGPDGNPILSLTAYNGKYRMWGPGYSEVNQQNPPTGAYGSWGADFASSPSVGQWHLFTLHVKWSPDPAKGYVALYGDLADGRGWRQLVSGRNVATMKINDSGGNGETIPTHARAGIYRDESHTSDTWVDIAGYTVATTRAAAEANAFRPEVRPTG